MTLGPRPRMPRSIATLALIAAACLPAASAGPVLAGATPPPPPGTTTPTSPAQSTVEHYVLVWLNADRAARGLRPLRLDGRLQTVARERAGGLADLGLLSHTAAGNLTSQLASVHAQWYAWGEDLGWTGASWGYSAAKSLYSLWKHSPAHWSLMMSSGYNYVGIGVGYRWSGRATYASIVFSNSSDHTRPIPKMTGRSISGTTIRFTWRGADVPLQLHTSGVRSYDVDYRVDGGTWQVIKAGTHVPSITLSSRPHQHTYWVRVRVRDWAGNVSDWSSTLHVFVP